MIEQIHTSEGANLCKRILAVISAVYRPVTLNELTSFVDMPNSVSRNDMALSEIRGRCGSFLTLRGHSISFVHLSAKNFLLEEASDELFPSGTGIAGVHRLIFSRSSQAMSNTPKQDMYSLRAFEYPADQVKQPDPDPLTVSRYSCIYYIDHRCNWNPSSSAKDFGLAHIFV